MGSNFLVAAFVPAMGFIVACLFVFGPVLPFDVLEYSGKSFSQLFQTSIITLVSVTVLGYTLYALSTYIYKAFEGYSFILGRDSFLRRSFVKRQIRRYKRIEVKRNWVEKERARVDIRIKKEWNLGITGAWKEKRLDRLINRRMWLEDIKYSLTSEHDEKFPPSVELIMPTRFGNILRAAETYPGTRYSIDAVPIWGRMAHVIPADGMEKIDDAHNQCLFLLNMALLSCLFSILCFLVSAHQFLVGREIGSLKTLFDGWIGIYLVLGSLALIIAWFFYEASLLNVSQYGSMIRTAYDLYRFDLLDALRFELPTTLESEKQTWRKISNFMTGNEPGKPLEVIEIRRELGGAQKDKFRYLHPEKQKTQDKPEVPWYERGIG